MRKPEMWVWPLLLVLALASGPVLGQADRAVIQGTVVDSTGALLPGVEIVATNVQTGVVTRGLTNDVGNYSLINLPIGTYQVAFALPGFKTSERTDFTVTTGQRARLDVTLEVGELTETITISATSALIASDSPLVSTTMQSEVITDLPLSFAGGRAVENFAYAVTPGVEGDNWTSFLVGGQAFSKEVLIDGVSATAHIQGHIGESSPTMEAVQEFKVQTSGMSAEYGRTSGGVFNFALKSGSNKFSGSAFYYFRNESLNANTWMNNWNLSQDPTNPRYERARDRQNLLGGSAGGPLVIPGLYNGRDRTFIFAALEHYERESYQLGPMNQTVPIPAFLDGDFSALLGTQVVGQDPLGNDVLSGQIFDPLTLRQVGSSWMADPFPGNIIPSDRISPISSTITDILRQQYKPMVSGRLTNNSALTETNTPWFHQTQLTAKADHALSDSHKLSGSVIWTQRPRILVDQGGLWNPEDPDGWGGPLSRARKQEVTSRRVVITDNYTFRPNLINTFSAAYNRYRNPSVATAHIAGGNWASDLGLGQTKYGNFPQVSFGSSVNGIGTTQIGYNANSFYATNTYILSDHLDWIKGRHNFKFGGEVWWQQHNAPDDNDMMQFNYAHLTTGLPQAGFQNRVGFGFASFLLGEVNSASRGVPISLYGRRGYVSFYMNDDFKLNPKLTLNLGLRWEQAQPMTEVNGNWANFTADALNTNPNGLWPIDPGVPGALVYASGPNTTFEGDRDWKAFSPRLGLAYRMSENMVVRSGYGIFYSPLGTQQWGGIPYGTFAAPDIAGTDQITQISGGTVPVFNWDNGGYPGNFHPGNRDPNFLTWGMVSFDENTLKLGYTHQWNASVQYEFTPDTMVEVAYIGNNGNRLHSGVLRRNQARRDVYEAIPNPGDWVWDEGSAAAAGVPYPFPGFSGYAGMAVLPLPQVAHCGWGWCPWGPQIYVSSPLGDSSYNSLQIDLTRRLAAGLAANVSYAYSKTKGNTETMFDESWDYTGGIQDMYNLKEAADTVVSYDRAHVFKGLAQFELPFGRGRRWLSGVGTGVDAVLGGWSLTTIFRYDTGIPLGINPNVWLPAWTDPSNGAVYADVTPGATFATNFDGKGFNPGNTADPGNNYFNPGDFAQPAWGMLGNGARRYDRLRGFGTSSEDIGFMKYWSVGETARLQFRTEVLNVFNRHYYQNPQTTITNAATFGQVISTVGLPRNIQMGFRFQW